MLSIVKYIKYYKDRKEQDKIMNNINHQTVSTISSNNELEKGNGKDTALKLNEMERRILGDMYKDYMRGRSLRNYEQGTERFGTESKLGRLYNKLFSTDEKIFGKIILITYSSTILVTFLTMLLTNGITNTFLSTMSIMSITFLGIQQMLGIKEASEQIDNINIDFYKAKNTIKKEIKKGKRVIYKEDKKYKKYEYLNSKYKVKNPKLPSEQISMYREELPLYYLNALYNIDEIFTDITELSSYINEIDLPTLNNHFKKLGLYNKDTLSKWKSKNIYENETPIVITNVLYGMQTYEAGDILTLSYLDMIFEENEKGLNYIQSNKMIIEIILAIYKTLSKIEPEKREQFYFESGLSENVEPLIKDLVENINRVTGLGDNNVKKKEEEEYYKKVDKTSDNYLELKVIKDLLVRM